MCFMGESQANYVKSLDCRRELASEAKTKTGNELLLNIKLKIKAERANSLKTTKL